MRKNLVAKKTQAVKVRDPECFQKLPPNSLLNLDGDTATTIGGDGNEYVNFVSASGSGESIFEVVPFSESGANATEPAAGTNTGDGTCGLVTVSVATLTEDWTITCTDDTTEGEEVWSVTGTVSGLQTATATTGVEYTSDNGEVSFTITAGDTAFAAGDEFTFSTVRLASYIKAKTDCRIIFEGLFGRSGTTGVGGITINTGDESTGYGQSASSFACGIATAADIAFCTVSSIVQLNAGEGASFKMGVNDGTALAFIVRASSVFPE